MYLHHLGDKRNNVYIYYRTHTHGIDCKKCTGNSVGLFSQDVFIFTKQTQLKIDKKKYSPFFSKITSPTSNYFSSVNTMGSTANFAIYSGDSCHCVTHNSKSSLRTCGLVGFLCTYIHILQLTVTQIQVTTRKR